MSKLRQVLKLHCHGQNKLQISAITGLSRNTVKKYIRTFIGLRTTWEEVSRHSKGTLIYGLLRETWERAFEEVLLNGMVERYRENIQTQQILSLSDITQDDCKIFEEGMTKCSKWLPGHDLAAAENEEFPSPDELEKDILSLENWASTINKRRSSKLKR